MKHLKHIVKAAKGWLLVLLLLVSVGCKSQKEEKTAEVITPTPNKTASPTPSSQPTETPPPSPIPTEPPAPVYEMVGQASTNIFDNIPQRNNNLKIAIDAIDGMILNVGEEFSFNQTVGPRTKEKGYQEAIGYDENGDKVPTVGGGICQISSTLYMAAKNGGFPVIERHSHSHSVPYADSNNDATVSYDGYDFKFQNNRDMPIIIRISTDGATVAAELIQTNNIKSP